MNMNFYHKRVMWSNDPKLSHSHDERGQGEQKSKYMNLQNLIRKTESVVAVGCSALLDLIRRIIKHESEPTSISNVTL